MKQVLLCVGERPNLLDEKKFDIVHTPTYLDTLKYISDNNIPSVISLSTMLNDGYKGLNILEELVDLNENTNRY